MSIENLSDINTVNDLLELQKKAEAQENEPTVADKLMDLIIAEDPAVGITVAYRVIHALRDFHKAGVEQYNDEGNLDAALVWHTDYTKLDQALNLIEHIQL